MVELPALQRALDLSSGVAARRSLFWSSSPVQSAGWPALAQPAARPSAQIARIGFATAEQVQRLAESLDVSHVEREAGYVVALVTAGEGERLEAQGHTVDADEALTATLSAVAGYPCQRTMDGMYADLVIPAAHPDIVQSYTIGYSFEDRPLIVARLTNRAIAGDKPVPFVMGGIHGREMVTVEGVMAIRREPTADRHKGGTHARIDRRPAFGPVQAPAL